MFKRLRDALFSPSSLADYKKDRWWITTLFFVMLVVISTLPNILYYLTPQRLTEDDSLLIRKEFEGLDIPFEIVNGELVNYSEQSNLVITELVAKQYIIMITTSENVPLNETNIIFKIGKNKVTKYHNQKEEVIFEYREYPRLNNLDFNDLSQGDYMEWDLVNSVINAEIKSNYGVVAFANIAQAFLVTFFTYLILSLLLVVVNRMNFANIEFMTGWKLLIYCFAPYAFGELLAGLYGISMLSFVGIVLTVFFSTKVLRKVYLERGK